MGIININGLRSATYSRRDYKSTFPISYCNDNPSSCSGLNISYFGTFVKAYNYLGMRKMYCITWTDDVDRRDYDGEFEPYATTCFYRFNNMMLIPTLSHWDLNPCGCPNMYDLEKCNIRNMLLSYFYFVNETYDHFPHTIEFAARAAILLRKSIDNDEYFNNITHAAGFESMGGNDEASGAYVVNNTILSEAYDTLCQDLGCAMITFSLYDENKADMNEFNLDLPYIACNSTFYQPLVFKDLKATTDEALKLQNDYYECKNGPFDIASYVVGISTGNAQVVNVVAMFIFFFFLGQYLRRTIGYRTGYGDPENHDHPKSQKARKKERKNIHNRNDFSGNSFTSQSEIELNYKIKELEKSLSILQNEFSRQQRNM